MPPPRFPCSHTIKVFREEVKCRRGFIRKDFSCLCDQKKFYEWYLDGKLVTRGRSLYLAPYELVREKE